MSDFGKALNHIANMAAGSRNAGDTLEQFLDRFYWVDLQSMESKFSCKAAPIGGVMVQIEIVERIFNGDITVF